MPLDLQAKLLRVLEDRTVRRLGGSKTVPVDFRLVCSTNLDPVAAVREGQLRQDLYFRINTVTVTLPPLHASARRDIPVLAKAFLERFKLKHGREIEGIEPEAYRRLLSYRGRATCGSSSMPSSGPCSWPVAVKSRLPICPRRCRLPPLPTRRRAPPGSLEEIERVSIVRALETSGWNKQAAAALLGLRRPTLYSKMRRHGIPQRRGPRGCRSGR